MYWLFFRGSYGKYDYISPQRKVPLKNSISFLYCKILRNLELGQLPTLHMSTGSVAQQLVGKTILLLLLFFVVVDVDWIGGGTMGW